MEILNKVVKNEISEYQLIKIWQRKHDENIALYFFEKYKEEILKVIFFKINRKFSSIPIEKGDLFHVVWKAVLNCLKEYNFEKRINFKAMIITEAYNLSIKEALKFLTNKHIVLNTSYSYEHLFTLNKNFDLGENGIVKNDVSYTEATKRFIENIVEFNKEFPVDRIKKAIYLKSLGYSNRDIAKKLRLKVYYIVKMFKYICKIAKKIYY